MSEKVDETLRLYPSRPDYTPPSSCVATMQKSSLMWMRHQRCIVKKLDWSARIAAFRVQSTLKQENG